MKKILVICALGNATSTMVKRNIEEFLKERKIDGWTVDAVGMGMSQEPAKTASIIVTTVQLDQKEYKAPIIDGISLISGIDCDKTFEEIDSKIKEFKD